MARLGGERRSQVPWLRALAAGCLAARLGGERRSQVPSLCTLADGRLRLVHTFRARLLRWGSIADSFQHAPEAGGGAAGDGHHVAGAEKR